MPTDNTLGAPTEGLGQTITFALPGERGVPQASAGAQVAVRNELRGGEGVGANRALQVAAPPPDQTLNVLLRMGQDIIAPKIKQAKEASFVDGMQRAAAGQAVADIVDEQPWYAKVFGPTDLVDGARAYSAATKASEIATGIELAMPELRKLTGPEFSAHVNKQLQESKTGDGTADAMVASSILKQMPQSMASQAKNHYLYRQEVFTEQQRGSMQSALVNIGVIDMKARKTGDGQHVPGDAYMPGAMNDTADETDSLLAKQTAMAAFVRPAHQDPKLHSRNVATVLAAQGALGNLAGLYTVKDAGIIDNLQPQDQVTVLAAIDQAERKTKMSIDAPLAIQGGHWQSLARDPSTKPEDIIAGAKELNAQYAQLTGSRAPLVSQADTVRELVQLENTKIEATHREASRLQTIVNKATKLNEKQAAKNGRLELGAAALSTGEDISFLENAEEIQEAFALKKQQALQSGDMSGYYAAMANSSERKGGIDISFRDGLQTALNVTSSQADPIKLHEAYERHYLPLRKAAGARGQQVAATYAGDYAAKMDDYHRFIQATGQVSDDDKMVALLAFNKPRVKVDNSKDAVALQRQAGQVGFFATAGNLISVGASYLPGGGAVPHAAVDEGLLPQFVSELMPYMDNLPASLDAKGKLREAAKLAQIEQYGGTYWRKTGEQADIEKLLVKPKLADGVTPNTFQIQQTELDQAVKLGFSKKLATVGLSADGVSAYRAPDVNGEAVFYLVSTNVVSGEPDGVMVKGGEIESAWRATKVQASDDVIKAARRELEFANDPYYTKPGKAGLIRKAQSDINAELAKRGQPPEFKL